MPCYDSRSDDGSEARELRERLDVATRVACELAREMQRLAVRVNLSLETISWVHRHLEEDAKREERKAAKLASEEKLADLQRKGRSKLTNEERIALGL